MSKKILLFIFILILPIVNAYYFDYPTPYYYDKENIEVNMSFIEQFENYVPDYLRDRLEIEFTTRKNNYFGYTSCHSLNGPIEITMYRSSWIDYEYYITEGVLLHELAHVYQCRVLYQYPNHKNSFYEINLWKRTI